jgi:hypothetical protein
MKPEKERKSSTSEACGPNISSGSLGFTALFKVHSRNSDVEVALAYDVEGTIRMTWDVPASRNLRGVRWAEPPPFGVPLMSLPPIRSSSTLRE